MALKTLSITQFNGGISSDEKVGNPNSFRRLEHINIHGDYSQASLFPKLTKVSGSTVETQVKWIVDATPFDTNRYFYDSSGHIYRETNAGTWSKLRDGSTIANGAAGQGMDLFDDFLYYATSTTIGRYGYLSGTPAFDDDFLTDGTTNQGVSGGGTGAADYVPPVAISDPEVATARQSFTPTEDTLKSITIDVDVVGTGDWTLTVHDSLNVSIGSKTIVNGSMAVGDVEFVFAIPLRVTIDDTYHFHVTSTVADGGVDTDEATSLAAGSGTNGAEFTTLFGILVADSNWHPTLFFKDILAVGNERYLATWDTISYYPNKLDFGPGWKVRTLTMLDEFLVIGCVRSDTVGDAEQGRLYFWDGLQPTYNYYKDTPLGSINAVHNSKNRLMSIIGQKGTIYFGVEPFQKVQDLQLLDDEATVEVFPGAVTEWQGKSYIGFAGKTAGTNIDDTYLGVYEFGSRSDAEQEAVTHVQTISTTTSQANNVYITALKGIGSDMYVAWEDNSAYGVDKVSLGDSYHATGYIDSLIFDGGNPSREKILHSIKITYEGLAAGATVTPRYKINRGTWNTGTADSTDGSTSSETHFLGKRFKELEFGAYIQSSSNNNVVITGIYVYYDDNEEEDDL